MGHNRKNQEDETQSQKSSTCDGQYCLTNNDSYDEQDNAKDHARNPGGPSTNYEAWYN